MIILILAPIDIKDKLPLMFSIFFVMPVYQLLLITLVPATQDTTNLEKIVSNLFYLILFMLFIVILSYLLT